jgi:hypothetical protein
MSKLLDLIRDERRRRTEPEQKVVFVGWDDDGDGPHLALGLQQGADEPYSEFTKRVTAEAVAQGVRHVWIERVFVEPAVDQVGAH